MVGGAHGGAHAVAHAHVAAMHVPTAAGRPLLVMVGLPRPAVDGDEPHARFHHPPREETVGGEGSIGPLHAVQVEHADAGSARRDAQEAEPVGVVVVTVRGCSG